MQAYWQIHGMFFKVFSQSPLVCIRAGIVFVLIFTFFSSPCISAVSFLRSLKHLFYWCGCVVRNYCWYVQAWTLSDLFTCWCCYCYHTTTTTITITTISSSSSSNGSPYSARPALRMLFLYVLVITVTSPADSAAKQTGSIARHLHILSVSIPIRTLRSGTLLQGIEMVEKPVFCFTSHQLDEENLG